MFGLRREEMAGIWRRLHSKKLHNLRNSRNIISVIKSSRVRWVVHVARVGEMRTAYQILFERREEKRPL